MDINYTKIASVLLLVVVVFVSGCTESSTKELNTFYFNQTITDSAEDCISVQTDNSLQCIPAIDISNVVVMQNREHIWFGMSVNGNIPSSSAELEMGEFTSESYEYNVFLENEKGNKIILSGIIDELDTEGLCTEIATGKDCADPSEIKLEIDNNKITVIIPYSKQIKNITKIYSIYQPSTNTMEELESSEDIRDNVEI